MIRDAGQVFVLLKEEASHQKEISKGQSWVSMGPCPDPVHISPVIKKLKMAEPFQDDSRAGVSRPSVWWGVSQCHYPCITFNTI
jgi:hypothetical protein